MSMMRSVTFDATVAMAPLAPAGTSAALASAVPVGELSVETPGYGSPEGHVDKKPSGPGGRTVRFSEYAWAVAGGSQELDRIGKSRSVYVARLGGPKDPLKSWEARVSAIRHGVSGKKSRPVEPGGAK